MASFPKYLLEDIESKLQHIDIVFWKGNDPITLYIDHVESFVIEKKYDIEDDKGYTYRGTSTHILPELHTKFETLLNQIQEKVNLESPEYKKYYTFSLIINDTVYFVDLLNNILNNDNPYESIGKMYLMREMIDVFLKSRKLKYLEQDHIWIHKTLTNESTIEVTR